MFPTAAQPLSRPPGLLDVRLCTGIGRRCCRRRCLDPHASTAASYNASEVPGVKA